MGSKLVAALGAACLLSVMTASPAAADAGDRRLVTSIVTSTFNTLTYSEQSDLCAAWDFSHAMAYRELGPAFYSQGISRYDTKRGIYMAFTQVC